MILAFDTYYFNNKAHTVCVSFKEWTDTEPFEIFEETIEGVAEYESGQFYKRELPCIMSILKNINYEIISTIIVDSFVFLDDFDKMGLGAYLYKSLEEKIPVIGVAKTCFFQNKKNVKELLRGESKNPLYISSIGIDLDLAFEKIKSMSGDYRMPTLLKILDTKTREI